MDLGIKGKKALVVGASKNIGAAIAQKLANEGCRVTVVARDEALLKELVSKMGGAKDGHAYLATDLLTEGAPSDAAKILVTNHGPFDIVVHNIGGALGIKDILGPIEDWEKVWKFNAGIAIEMNRLLLLPMIKKGWGRVIHISSISGELGEPLTDPFGGAIPYAASKAYLNSYVRGLGRELASKGVIVTALMPGAVLSEGKYWEKMTKSNPDLAADFLERFYPIKRFGRPAEIASFVVFLASKQASFAAGSIVPISGGRV